MSTVIGNNPTNNAPIVISYGDTWPGKEAGQTIEYEREPDGSQGREIKRSGSSSGGSSTPPPEVLPGDDPIGEVIEVEAEGTKVKVDSRGNIIGDNNKIMWGPSTGNKTAIEIYRDRVKAGIPVFEIDKKTGKLVYNPDNKLGMSYEEATKNQREQIKEFTENNVELKDGTWLPKTIFDGLDKKYRDIGKDKGFDAMVDSLLDDGYEVDGKKREVTPMLVNQGKMKQDFRVSLELGPTPQEENKGLLIYKTIQNEIQAIDNRAMDTVKRDLGGAFKGLQELIGKAAASEQYQFIKGKLDEIQGHYKALDDKTTELIKSGAFKAYEKLKGLPNSEFFKTSIKYYNPAPGDPREYARLTPKQVDYINGKLAEIKEEFDETNKAFKYVMDTQAAKILTAGKDLKDITVDLAGKTGKESEKIKLAIQQATSSDQALAIKNGFETIQNQIGKYDTITTDFLKDKGAKGLKTAGDVAGSIKDYYTFDSKYPKPDMSRQDELKAKYDEQQRIANLPLNERIDKNIVKSVLQWDGVPIVIKNNDGTYSEMIVKGGTATMAGGSPQSMANLFKAAVALGVSMTPKFISSIQEFKEKYGRNPQAGDLVAIDTKNGMAFGWTRPNDDILSGKLPDDFKKVTLPQLKGMSNYQIPELTGISVGAKMPDIPGTSTNVFKPDTYILDPRVTDKSDADDYLLKAFALASAESILQKKSKEFDWDDIIKDSRDINNPEVTSSLERAYENLRRGSPLDYNNQELTSALDAMYRRSKVDPVDLTNQDPESSFARYQVMRTKGLKIEEIMKALDDYGAKQAILEDARKSYVASLNPTPVSGTMDLKATYILAAHRLASEIQNNTKLSADAKTQLINQVNNQLAQDLKTATLTSTKTATTTKPAQLAQSATKTDTRTTPAEATRTAELSTPAELTRTGELTRPAELTRTAEMTRTARLTTRVKPPPPVLPPGSGEDKKPLKLKPGSLAWQQGTLEVNPDKPGPEKVIKYAEPMKYQVVTIVDRTPKGYQDKGTTPKETIQTIGGPVKRRVTVDIGVTQAIADGNSITFISKPRQPKLRPPKLPKPTKLDTRPGRIVRVHKARRGGGYTRRSNR